MEPLSGKNKRLLISISIVLVALLMFFTVTGFYTKLPTPKGTSAAEASPGETVWFIRRGTIFGFASSADSFAIAQGFSPNAKIRANLDAEFEIHAFRRVLGRFGFSRFLYLLSTGFIDLAPDKPEKKQTPPSADGGRQ
jgi:hypothetical protein